MKRTLRTVDAVVTSPAAHDYLEQCHKRSRPSLHARRHERLATVHYGGGAGLA